MVISYTFSSLEVSMVLECVSCKLKDNSALACSHLEIQYGVHLNHCKSILDLKGKANFDNEIKTGHV